MRDSAKLKSKCKHTNSPSKIHLSTSMSNENVAADDQDVVINVETSDKNETDKNKGRHNFWPFGHSGDKKTKSEKSKEKCGDRKKLKSSESSGEPENVTATTASATRSSKRRATLEPSGSPSVSTTTPRPTRCCSFNTVT